MNAPSRWKKAALLGPGLMLLMIVGTSAYAQEATRTFHIPAQLLANALVSFSEQSGIPVMAPADLVRDKAAPAVDGTMPPLAALDTLLKSSGLKYSRSAEGALTIAQAPTVEKTVSRRATEKRAAPKAETEIEEIIVTAQRREESIQETPISVAVLTTESMRAQSVNNIVDIGTAVPNMRIVDNPGSPSTTTISIRGLAQGNFQPSFSPKVGLYVDGVYIAQLKGSNLDLDDIERVEVLRGPQGTLYGRNTIGGAVNFISRKPTEERSVTLKTEVGNFDTFNGRLTANVPLVGTNGVWQSDALGVISLRETVGYKTHEGYFRNALPPNAPPQPAVGGGADYNDLNRIYTTTAVRWQPRTDVTLDYAFEYHRYRDHTAARQLTYIYPGSIADSNLRLPNGSLIPNPRFPGGLVPYVLKNRSDAAPSNALLASDLVALHPNRDDGNHRMHTVTAAWDLGDIGSLGSVTLRSIAHYRSFVAQTESDGDGTPQHISDIGNTLDTQTWGEELQWIGTTPRLRYVLGAYYFGEYDQYTQQLVVFSGASVIPFRNFRRDKSYAPYGQATWTPPILGDKLSVTAGLRYTQEQIHLEHLFGRLVYPKATSPGFKYAGGEAFGGTDALSPMADLSYQWTDDLMTYFRVSRGFASGGFNDSCSIPQLCRSFDPETLWTFEGGFKSQWLDNRLRVNADGFFSYYEDLQVTVFHASPTLGNLTIPANADSAEIWGMEFEATAIPFPGLEASVGYSFLAPKYNKWMDQKFDANNAPIFDSSGNPVQENVADKRAFPFSPNHQATLGFTYTAPPTTTGVFSAHLNLSWQDKVVFIANNQTPGSQADEGWAYALANGRLSYSGIPLQKGSLDIAVYGRNLFDRKYRTFAIDFGAALGVAVNSYGDPRTFGLQLIYNFSAS